MALPILKFEKGHIGPYTFWEKLVFGRLFEREREGGLKLILSFGSIFVCDNYLHFLFLFLNVHYCLVFIFHMNE